MGAPCDWIRWKILAVVLTFCCSGFAEREPGWGIDACLSCHVDRSEVPGFIQLLRQSKIAWLRERGPGVAAKDQPRPDWMVDKWDNPRRRVWRDLKAAGFRVVAFAGSLKALPVEQPGNQLSEDLRGVYSEAKRLGAVTLGEVDAFEMVGEPDAHYCKDLPDRVAAYQKAVYLGIKEGARQALRNRPDSSGESSGITALSSIAHQYPSDPLDARLPIVLSGGLAFPPGNWLDLAVENGIYEFTDAVNFHHYGFADDLQPAIQAHREFGAQWSGRGELPVWITETGLNNIPPGQWDNTEARQAQARYIVDCAAAAHRENIPVFMPFILAHKADPFSMTEGSDRVFPAWEAYRDFTIQNPIARDLPLIDPPAHPPRTIMQWMPDNETCVPFKVGGTYWFKNKSPMLGTLWVYNFSERIADIRIRRDDAPGVQINGRSGVDEWTLRVPAGDRRGLAVEIDYPIDATTRQTLRFSALSASETRVGAVRAARVVFRVGTRPDDSMPQAVLPTQFEPPSRTRLPDGFSYVSAQVEPPMITSQKGAWIGLNGVQIPRKPISPQEDKLKCLAAEIFPGPLHPPMLVSQVNGLSGKLDQSMIRLTVKDGDGNSIGTRIDLIDDAGQRFTIIENLGRLRDEPPASTVWLAYADFHPWVFGTTVPGSRFAPERVREVQLRFYGLGPQPRLLEVEFDVVEFLKGKE